MKFATIPMTMALVLNVFAGATNTSVCGMQPVTITFLVTGTAGSSTCEMPYTITANDRLTAAAEAGYRYFADCGSNFTIKTIVEITNSGMVVGRGPSPRLLDPCAVVKACHDAGGGNGGGTQEVHHCVCAGTLELAAAKAGKLAANSGALCIISARQGLPNCTQDWDDGDDCQCPQGIVCCPCPSSRCGICCRNPCPSACKPRRVGPLKRLLNRVRRCR